MKPAAQPGLFDREQPTEIEVGGPELASVVKDLESRGALVWGLVRVCGASYRLQIRWPESALFRV